MTRGKAALAAGVLLVLAEAGVEALHLAPSSPVVRTVSLGAINLPFAARVDVRAGRVLVASESPRWAPRWPAGRAGSRTGGRSRSPCTAWGSPPADGPAGSGRVAPAHRRAPAPVA